MACRAMHATEEIMQNPGGSAAVPCTAVEDCAQGNVLRPTETAQMHKPRLPNQAGSPSQTSARGSTTGNWVVALTLASLVSVCAPLTPAAAQAADPAESDAAKATPQAYVVRVDLPLIGTRDEDVKQQINKIKASSQSVAGEERITVILQFQSNALSGASGERSEPETGSRGSQFTRCFELARYLTNIKRLRLIAYLPESVEGHAVLPVLACEGIVAAKNAQLGAASIDEPADQSIELAYLDIASKRGSMPPAVVRAMLESQAEVYEVSLLGDRGKRIVSRDELDALRERGEIDRETTIWAGGALASFSGEIMKNHEWSIGKAENQAELSQILGVSNSLRTIRQLPRQWQTVAVTLTGTLTSARVNQIMRGITEAVDNQGVNFVLLKVQPTETDFTQAKRLASYIAGLDPDAVYTLAILDGDIRGPASLVAVACNEVVLLASASIGPSETDKAPPSPSAVHRFLDDFARETGRPLPLMACLANREVLVKEYIQQETARHAIYTDWQMDKQLDAQLWLEQKVVAGGGPVDSGLALQYRLVDSVENDAASALGRLGVEAAPEELEMSWLDATIQMLISQSWLPRLLLTIGFFALMAELGNPGIGVGGFLAAICFVGFFWIEGLNGNVESLEILLFVCGLIALALEVFVIPGFGVFGIGGLLMLLVSVVLASQTFIWPTNSAQLSELSVNLFWVACLAMGGMIGLLMMHKQLERSPLLKWVTLNPSSADELEELELRETTARRQHLLGQEGITTTRLNPSGKAQFGNDVVAVVGTGKLIRDGVPVRVIEVRGPLVLVEELESIG